MKVTAVQWKPSFADADSNWKRMEEYSERSDSDIIVFPELFSSGYNFDSREEILPHSDTTERLSRLTSIAAKSGKLIAGGFSETLNGEVYDSAFALADGKMNIYRKLHLWAKETQIFKAGSECVLFDYRKVRIGLEICYDLQFPELGRLLSSRGADIVLCPMAWAEEPTYLDKKTPIFVHLAIAEAFSNGMFTVIANRVGTERGAVFEGHSGVADPYGNFAGLERGEGEFTTEIEPSDVNGARKPSPYNDLGKDRKLKVSL